MSAVRIVQNLDVAWEMWGMYDYPSEWVVVFAKFLTAFG